MDDRQRVGSTPASSFCSSAEHGQETPETSHSAVGGKASACVRGGAHQEMAAKNWGVRGTVESRPGQGGAVSSEGPGTWGLLGHWEDMY